MTKKITSSILAILSFALICSFGCVTTATASNATDSEANIILELHDNDFYLTQANSIRTYNKILDELRSYEKPFSLSDDSYPEYYGGAYIDDETGELVILIKNLENSAIDDFSTTFGLNNEVKYQVCDVSYNEVLNAVNVISDSIKHFDEIGIYIDAVSDDILNGRVVVSVQDLNEKKANEILTYTNLERYDFIVFEESFGALFDESFGAGYGIYSTDDGSMSTIGFAAKCNGQEGFVIAGHAGNNVNEVFMSGSTIIGSVTKTAFYNNSSADAAFVRASSGVTATSIMKSGGHIWAASSYELPVNTTIMIYGNISGLQSGKLIGTSSSITGTDKNGNRCTITGYWTSDYTCSSGDSGAPVLLYEGNYGGSSKYTLLGIHSGTKKGLFGGETKFFSPYNNIVKELGVTCITN